MASKQPPNYYVKKVSSVYDLLFIFWSRKIGFDLRHILFVGYKFILKA